ncbi:FdtA/QdtA family cupin domain-containing protein [Cytobacillus praedii]|uniref:sugar 3,4-ketoisomerase n=1 Tax=Cytobacillus praedii TaxID=1742358 RepID=UPI002E1A4643|nr:FdtA/QdtA family cupin domain-containing protein [Cytobacillus praedii]
MNMRILNFELHGDKRGSLISLEENKNIPFEIKRVYYIFNTKEDVQRGFHAHKQLQQILICLNGSCKIKLDNGVQKRNITLDNPKRGLYIGNMIWREMYNFSDDCVLMVLANNFYVEEDYIREYSDFIKMKKNNV